MFVRVKKVGPYQYLQIAENRREGKRVKQSIIATLGRLDKLTASGAIDQLLRSAARFKDLIEEELFARRRDLFSALDLVFFDTTSLFFTGSVARIRPRGGACRGTRTSSGCASCPPDRAGVRAARAPCAAVRLRAGSVVSLRVPDPPSERCGDRDVLLQPDPFGERRLPLRRAVGRFDDRLFARMQRHTAAVAQGASTECRIRRNEGARRLSLCEPSADARGDEDRPRGRIVTLR